MFELPYQTTFCIKLYKNLDTLASKIRLGGLQMTYPEMFNSAKKPFKGLYFVTPHQEHSDVPVFTQYLNIGNDQQPKLLIDGRQYLREDRASGLLKSIADNDWHFQSVRMALNLKLLDEGNSFFMGLGDIPARVFGRWISGMLTSKYQLSIESQICALVVATYYYYAMVNPEIREGGTEAREMLVTNVSRVTGAVPDMVFNLLEDLGPLRSIEDLCYALSNNTQQQRTGAIKYQDLIMLLSTSWFGINARENVAISLEHLPTFVAMVFMGLSSSNHKKTVIAQRALSSGRPNEIKSFTDLIFRLSSEYLYK